MEIEIRLSLSSEILMEPGRCCSNEGPDGGDINQSLQSAGSVPPSPLFSPDPGLVNLVGGGVWGIGGGRKAAVVGLGTKSRNRTGVSGLVMSKT